MEGATGSHVSLAQMGELYGGVGIVGGQARNGKVTKDRKPRDRCKALTACVSILPDGTHRVMEAPQRNVSNAAKLAREQQRRLAQQERQQARVTKLAQLAAISNQGDYDVH